ncbi:MAG: hypothetical protein ACXADY_15700 [Candidatus Hodarchaeales archaeon]|jgi:sulfur carrier protein ThiS
MISITIEMMAAVRNPFPSEKRKNKLTELPDGITIKKLLLQVSFLKKELEHLIPIVNGSRVPMDHQLEDGDYLWITFPLGGGLQ